MTCTVTVGGSPQRGVGAAGGGGQAGAGGDVMSQTATVRGPNRCSTSAGLTGQATSGEVAALLAGPAQTAAAGPHQATTVVPDIGLV